MKKLFACMLAALLALASVASVAEETLAPFTLEEYQAFMENYAEVWAVEWQTDESGAVCCDYLELSDPDAELPCLVCFTLTPEGYVAKISVEGTVDMNDEDAEWLYENALNRIRACALLSTNAFMVKGGYYSDALAMRYAPPMMALLAEGGETLVDGCRFFVQMEEDDEAFRYACALVIIPEETPAE